MTRKSNHLIGHALLVMAVFLLIVCAAPGQTDPDAVVPIPNPLTVLLRDAGVHEELELNPKEIALLQAALDEVDLPLWRLRDLPVEQRNAPAKRLLDRLDERAEALLSAAQRKRLDQLTLQAHGLFGLLEPAVVRTLALSSDQRRDLQTIVDTLAQNLTQLQQGGLTAHEQGEVRRLQDQAQRDVLALFNVRQRRRLTALTGSAYDFSGMRQRVFRAPELRDVAQWLNSEPVRLADLRGNVVVVHFYTFGCINCIRNLPHYVAWQKHFAGRPVRIIGIHRPETAGEHVIETVRAKASEAGLTHPIAIDNDSANWNAWANRVWPSVYLIDKQGFVRDWWYGELDWQGAEGERTLRDNIEKLLAEEG